MERKAVVFLSCGQREGEKEIAEAIQRAVERKFGLECFNAQSRQGFDDVMSITEHLAKADYYLFVDFYRSSGVPISVFTHQEFALAHASRFTEMIAFREKGISLIEKNIGMAGYVLVHPIEFEYREKLPELVCSEIERRGWNAGYSRNLVAGELRKTGIVQYGDGNGSYNQRIWALKIENRRPDKAATNTTIMLETVEDIARGIVPVSPADRAFVKWAGQSSYQTTIFPGSWAEIDLFAELVDADGVFLHTASDVFPHKPIFTTCSTYRLIFAAYSEGFPLKKISVTISYQKPLQVNRGLLVENGTEVTVTN